MKAVLTYDKRLVATISGTPVVTSGSPPPPRGCDNSCKAPLRRAGSPGRYQPVQPMVRRACAMLHQAAAQLHHALATGLINGSIVEEADVVDFNKALNGAYNNEGGAANVLAHALATAKRITK